MAHREKYEVQRFKRKMANILKVILRIIYFSSTSIFPMYVLIFVFDLKSNLLYAITIAFVSLIIMDIVCSILEDIAECVYKTVLESKKKKDRKKEELRKKKEDEIKKLEKLILQKNSYREEIEKIAENCKCFKEEILQNEIKIPKDICKGLKGVCKKIKGIVEVLEKDEEEYYPIRHTFTVYFPEFQKMTYKFIDIAKGDSLDDETISEFMKLIEEFDQYLDFIKGSINTTDKLSLNVGIKSLIQIMESERKKGDT